MPVGVMLRSMTSLELTHWLAYYYLKADANRPKPQSPKEIRSVLNSMVRTGKGKRRR